MSEPRRPAPRPIGAIEPLATLPVFYKLVGRRVLVAGGTPPAVWKAELLAAAGAAVTVLAAHPCPEMEQLAATLAGRIALERRGWTPSDIVGAAIAIGAFEDGEGERFRDAARAAGVPVNVIDVPPLCDFQFGTIVARSPLVIGISTDGAAPVLGQALRARIEASLPATMGAWARAAKDWRVPLQALKLGFAARRRFWELFTDLALEGGERLPAEDDRLLCLEAAVSTERSGRGRIILVGAGPGGPDLVTLGAVRAFQSADLILFQPGIAAGTLGLARREAVRSEITDLAESATIAGEALAEGRTVAVMGPGDPASCSRWTRVRDALAPLSPAIETVRGVRCATCPDGCAAPR